MPRCCQLELAWPSYGLCKVTVTVSITLNVFITKFYNVYTENFSMHHYITFLQIRLQIT